MRHFVVVYNRRRRHLIGDVAEFARPDEALRARWDRDAEFRADPEVEVVILSAESRDRLEDTHARFFKTVTQLVG